jgi:uncharacterized protein YyaL (SSP411 family)
MRESPAKMTQPQSPADHAASNPSPHGTNRLSVETSPYLLQHARNPVDWYPWGAEALARAKAEDRPIFLSIGYSACHWCHVMERESFENPEIAAVMNEHFVNIKVDREERPDLDQIYMTAVQAMTGHGGWPMSVFLTPDLEPFFGGTYFPPQDSRGMPGFPRVLLSVHRAWVERRDEILSSAAEMTGRLRALGKVPRSAGSLGFELIDQAAHSLVRSFDRVHGGFGDAPKFLHPMDLKVLLRHHARTGDIPSLQAVTHTLDKMARGGIYDHLCGGFARYSTDERWLVPHFEKMLYDNALLAGVYLEAFQVTRRDDFARTASETLDYVLRRMTDPAGAFYSTEDADSEGEEGKYYVWTPAEIREILGAERAAMFCAVYDVNEGGNWEGHSILNLPRTIGELAAERGRDEAQLRALLAEDRRKLLEVREKRIPPAKDTKILTSWNGMMIASLAEGGRVLGNGDYLEAARKAASFLLDNLISGQGGLLLHSYKDGRARLNGYLDDYSCLIDGLTRLYEASGEARWIKAAIELAGVMLDQFADPEHGGFFYTGNDHETLIARQKDVYDNATPSATGTAVTALLRLGALTGREDFSRAGREALESVHAVMAQAPSASGQHLIALDFELSDPREIAIISEDNGELDRALDTVAVRYLPNAVIAPALTGELENLRAVVPLLADRDAIGGQVTTYICERFTCQQPVVGFEALERALDLLPPKRPTVSP